MLKIIRNEIIRLQTIITSVNTELTTIINEYTDIVDRNGIFYNLTSN